MFPGGVHEDGVHETGGSDRKGGERSTGQPFTCSNSFYVNGGEQELDEHTSRHKAARRHRTPDQARQRSEMLSLGMLRDSTLWSSDNLRKPEM